MSGTLVMLEPESQLKETLLLPLPYTAGKITIPNGDAFLLDVRDRMNVSRLLIIAQPARNARAEWSVAESFLIRIMEECHRHSIPETGDALVDLIHSSMLRIEKPQEAPSLAVALSNPIRTITLTRGECVAVLTKSEQQQANLNPLAQHDPPSVLSIWTPGSNSRGWLFSGTAWQELQRSSRLTLPQLPGQIASSSATVVELDISEHRGEQPRLPAVSNIAGQPQVVLALSEPLAIEPAWKPPTPKSESTPPSWSVAGLPRLKQRGLSHRRSGSRVTQRRSAAMLLAGVLVILSVYGIASIFSWMAPPQSRQVAATESLGDVQNSGQRQFGVLPADIASDTIALLPFGTDLYLATIAGLYQMNVDDRTLLPIALSGDMVGGRLMGNLQHAEIDDSSLVLVDGAAIFRMSWDQTFSAYRIKFSDQAFDCLNASCAVNGEELLILDAAAGTIARLTSPADDAGVAGEMTLPSVAANTGATLIAAGDLYLVSPSGEIALIPRSSGEQPVSWALNVQSQGSVAIAESNPTVVFATLDSYGASIQWVDLSSRIASTYPMVPGYTFGNVRTLAVQEPTGTIWWLDGNRIWQMDVV